ncbi:MAG: helix-turn-helix transcriptional regulator [Clostridia bacterium]|nr:helix-turn-helix transcriptional regulator [Clostridia bacterium]
MKYRYDLQEAGFTVENIDIQNVSRPQNYRVCFRNGRMKHGLIYTVSGQMCYVFHTGEKTSLFVNGGELVFIPKGCVYTGVYLEENTEIKIIQFDIASGVLPDDLSAPVKLEIPDAGELVEAFFEPMKHHTSHHTFYYLSCFYRLLWQIDECRQYVPKKYKKLQPALSEMTEYSYQNQTVSYYAELCNISEVSFRRLFREYTGMSPIEYRNDIRLTNARNKLQSGEYNVSEVAELCGFSNLSFFIRLYKKRYGYTPKKE